MVSKTLKHLNGDGPKCSASETLNGSRDWGKKHWLVSTHLNIPNGNLPQIGMNIKMFETTWKTCKLQMLPLFQHHCTVDRWGENWPIVPKPELRALFGDSLTKPPFGVTNRRWGRYNLPVYSTILLTSNFLNMSGHFGSILYLEFSEILLWRVMASLKATQEHETTMESIANYLEDHPS